MGFITDLLKDIPLSTVIREKLIEAEKKVSILEKQNNDLEANLNQANSEIENFKKLNQELQRATEKHDEVTEQILQQFFDAGRNLPLEHFASSLSLKANIVKFHFDILLNLKYIDYASAGLDLPGLSGFTQYLITAKGRKYVMETLKP